MATFKMENCYQLLSKWHYSSVTTLLHLPLHTTMVITTLLLIAN